MTTLTLDSATGRPTVFETDESAVRSYSRAFPAVFTNAKGDLLVGEDGTRYIDFLSGAGTLNYGHNPDPIKDELIDYLRADVLVHGLDLSTSAKAGLLEALRTHVLQPRRLDYKVQFTSPSGTN